MRNKSESLDYYKCYEAWAKVQQGARFLDVIKEESTPEKSLQTTLNIKAQSATSEYMTLQHRMVVLNVPTVHISTSHKR